MVSERVRSVGSSRDSSAEAPIAFPGRAEHSPGAASKEHLNVGPSNVKKYSQMLLSEAEQATVRVFRRNAQDARTALAATTGGDQRMRVVDGYIEVEGGIDSFKRLCVPVRRAILANDSAYIGRTAGIIALAARIPDYAEAAAASLVKYNALQSDLTAGSLLGGRLVSHGELLRLWLDAAVFYDNTDKRRPYEEMLREMGRAVEGIAMSLTTEVGTVILAMDDFVADWLGEPRGVVPPPAPPRPPRQPTVWERIARALGRSE